MRRVFEWFMMILVVECASLIAQTYHLDPNSLGQTPVFNSNVQKKFISRATTPSKIQLAVNTTSFIIKLDCTPPFGDLNPLGTCQTVLRVFERAAKAIERNLYIKTAITLETLFYSFCPSPSASAYGTKCVGKDSTLGQASPLAMHV